ncbi:MAG: aminopeptidase P family protein [Actinobacteria bacterium]|nr:aminopeptidase P family protein [Actinomycetota bacterium]
MTDVLIHADTDRDPTMRHEVPLTVPDPFLYVEHDGRRYAVITAFERERLGAAAPDIEALAPEQFGMDELLRAGTPPAEAWLEVYTRALREIGVGEASIPSRFPVEIADHLRAQGVTLRVDRELFDGRRRSKTAAEIAGLRRAQRACEAALDVARKMLRESEARGGYLHLGGEPLTSERIKAEMQVVFIAHGAVADEFIVASGPQGAVGHDMGSGPIAADLPVVFDLWPRDTQTAVYTDMTRTYVVGTVPDEIGEYHRLCKEALDRTAEAARPGVNGRALMQIACDLFAEHGYPTQLTKQPGEVLDSGFFHGLGHGVGLEVHERPRLSVTGDELVPGDVITLEPGLYRAGYGGVRLEDILLVTDDGVETVTQYPYDLAP